MPRLTERKGERDMTRILIVDDEDTICKLYAEELRNEGYDVITTNVGKGLLEMIKEHRPELVVLDIRMGVYDGLDLLQDVRMAHYNLPVILCSAYSVYKCDMKSIAADYYVVKGYDLRELKAKVRMAIAGVEGMQLQLGEVLTGNHLPERIVPETDIMAFDTIQ